tara:strand:+ start:438 stop:659 length:222 start_codon:yes stop_codon:yes gene_type:complete
MVKKARSSSDTWASSFSTDKLHLHPRVFPIQFAIRVNLVDLGVVRVGDVIECVQDGLNDVVKVPPPEIRKIDS